MLVINMATNAALKTQKRVRDPAPLLLLTLLGSLFVAVVAEEPLFLPVSVVLRVALDTGTVELSALTA